MNAWAPAVAVLRFGNPTHLLYFLKSRRYYLWLVFDWWSVAVVAMNEWLLISLACFLRERRLG